MLYTEINSIWRLGVNWENLPEVEHVTWKRRMPWGIIWLYYGYREKRIEKKISKK